jgi:hypothetical protein
MNATKRVFPWILTIILFTILTLKLGLKRETYLEIRSLLMIIQWVAIFGLVLVFLNAKSKK